MLRPKQILVFFRWFASLGLLAAMSVHLLGTQQVFVWEQTVDSLGVFQMDAPFHGNVERQLLTLQDKPWHREHRFEHRDDKTLLDFVDAGPETDCPDGLFLANDTRLFDEPTLHTSNIPKVIHVTSKSRCMTKDFLDNLDLWRLPGYSVLVHNDAAVDAFLQRYWPEFPELPKAVHCLLSGAGKADLWRALMLWEYGGVYTDIDGAPNQRFENGNVIADIDESFFVVEKGGWLSQYFMSAMPHHPLMYLLVSKTIQRLYTLNDVDSQYVPRTTGPGPLKYAFIAFMNDQGNNIYEGVGDCNSKRNFKYGHVTAGRYTGWDNRTVTVVGEKGRSDAYVKRYSIKTKMSSFHLMNMTHFSEKETRLSPQEVETCFRRIYVRDQWSTRHETPDFKSS